MKNLGTLFGYEMKKIWKRPMTWIAVLVFSAGFVWYAPIPFYNYGRTYTPSPSPTAPSSAGSSPRRRRTGLSWRPPGSSAGG